ncbi:membrane protein [Curtobacterium pusillum]|uniref:DUF4126 family protein n=1 Tax=Curtobacterium pusillum TaxID=69373 RepID=A0AAW3T1T9_9MICO|nr:DUF4126 family protein [Curtobacterium pusillum]MBA8989256.1 putative membrane protein [Curtobacterium pusillum]NUU15477.1 DUF4126 family protein [Curtobacterium pusillum]GLK32804.1 hypothetical protein GCM10017610_30890 [Curtobacterium pusillum]
MSKNNEQHTLVRTLVLGILSGGRSATPLAVMALNHDRSSLKGSWQQWKVFSTPLGRGLLVASAVGEIIGDKLPKTPNRISPTGLVGRIGAGALAGAALGTTGKRDLRIEGAILGGVGALVGSFVGWGARKLVGATTRLPDPVVALAEDAATIAGSVKVVTAE